MNIIEFLRQYRIGQFAIFDFALAFLGMYLVAPFLTRGFGRIGLKFTRFDWILLTVPISVVVHLAIGTITPLTSMVIDPNGGYIAKVIVLALTLLGTRHIWRRK